MGTNLASVIEGLCSLKEKEPPEKNTISSYLPYRNKGADFDFDYVTGALVSVFNGVEISKKFDLGDFKTHCLEAIEDKAGSSTMTHCIDEIYFANDSENLKKFSPLFKILCTCKDRKEISPGSRHLEQILSQFIDPVNNRDAAVPNSNIFEKIIVEKFFNELKQPKGISMAEEAEPYLPFITNLFAKDFGFLSIRPTYFVDQAKSFLEIYTFLYCSQVALNIKDWHMGEPVVKPLYFILDTEKCSTERKAAGSYRDLLRSVGDIFPLLAMLEVLNQNIKKAGNAPLPIWKIFESLNDAETEEAQAVCEAIDSYTERFIAAEKPGRNLKPRDPASCIEGKLKLLFQYAIDQFDPQRQNEKDTKHEMIGKYKVPFDKEVALHFAQARGRLGKILVINQDYLLLLTNLAIGDRESVRLQELLSEFAKRGVYFDKQSELKLITFFERIGNIERMSDSGDAVYVRPTV